MVAGLGGETWTSASGSSRAAVRRLGLDQGHPERRRDELLRSQMYYLPTKTSVLPQYPGLSPQYQVFAKETETPVAHD